jgi:hypothetical protein
LARLKKGLTEVKLLELIFVLPARANIEIFDREKPNVSLYIGNVEEFYWIGKEQVKNKEVCSLSFNREKNYFEIIVEE